MKNGIKHSVAARVIVMIIASILASAIFLGTALSAFLYEYGGYNGKNEDDFRRQAISIALSENRIYNQLFMSYIFDNYDDDLYNNTNLTYTIYDRDGNVVYTTSKPVHTDEYRYLADFSVFDYQDSHWNEETGKRECEFDGKTIVMDDGYYTHSVAVYIDSKLPANDQFRKAAELGSLLFENRYNVAIATGVGIVVELIFVLFLMLTAGYRKDIEAVTGPFVRIPFDVITVAEIGFWGVCIAILGAFSYYDFELITALCIAAPFLFAAAMLWLMSIKIRVKNGTIIRNNITVRVARWCWKIVKKFFAFGIMLLKNIPLVWKTALICVGLFIVGVITITPWDGGVRLFLMLIFWLIISAGMLYAAIMLRRLQKGVQRMAAGDLNYKIDDKMLVLDFKKTAEELGNVSRGMTRAVEERMRSERFKTELITNVSHDIKTPLTSIINYADLISKEPTENEKITEYSGVLLRQSERLKKLIVDLVEASKASTGNIEVELAPMEVGVLISQTVGEYEQRLQDKNLQLVVNKPDHPVHIMADGRQIWRVFDNLMSNVCKYSMPGTRVYITLEDKNGSAVITFRNISSFALNMDGDELTERFVRGDASRNTEGNGLGLSIAKSLTDLMGGMLNITVDGDLFKAAVFFRKIDN